VHVTINGVSGWLGHATLGAIFESYPEINISNIQAIASSARLISSIEFGKLESLALADAKMNLVKTDTFVHLAFKTRDHIRGLGEIEYERLNLEIIENTLDAIRKSNPKNVVMVSSGVVSQWLGDQATFKKDSYIKIKLIEEAEIGNLCSELGINLVSLRLWGASGEHMTEPLKYAIGDLIHQDMSSQSLKINSAHLVYRRYADASQQMLICMRAANSGINETLESGGFIVEISELAQRIIELSGSRKQIIRPEIDASMKADEYFSTSRRMEELAESFGVQLKGLDDQILSTKNAVSRLILS